MAVDENPDRVLFWAPRSITLQAGIPESLVKPPAVPENQQLFKGHSATATHFKL